MHIDYEISEQDYLDAQRLAIKNFGSSRWTFSVIPWFGAFLLVFLAYTAITQKISWNFIPGTAFALFMVSVPILTKRAIRKNYAKSTNMHRPLSLDVDDAGIHFRGSTFDSQTQWGHFSKFFEDEESFVVFTSPRVFNIIPKRHLSPEQVVGLREYLAHNIHSST